MSSVGEAHSNGWVGALAASYNTDLVVSGGIDDTLNFYEVSPEKQKIEKKFSVRCVDY